MQKNPYESQTPILYKKIDILRYRFIHSHGGPEWT